MNLSSAISSKLPRASKGVVGMNYRNRHLVETLNPRPLIAIANDKVLTKTTLEARSVATPNLIAVIKQTHEIEPVYKRLVDRAKPFVLKPAQSAKGRGVVLFDDIDEEGATRVNGTRIIKSDFLFFIQQILQGEYSFGRPQDGVLLEEMIVTDADWVMPGLPGAPDLRIVLIEGEPVLAMARLPTALSDGRANLHCGAAGVGIDLKTCLTQGGIHNNKVVGVHPDTKTSLANNRVEDFDRCLELSRQCYRAVPLGLLGVDLMRDIHKGPLVIELNARPGLAIQIANRTGLMENI